MPSRLFLSSGDLAADRRFEFARDLKIKGDLAAAAELLEQAIELAPGFVSAWFELGEIRDRLGQREPAIAAWRRSRELDAADCRGAALRLMRLGAERVSEMPRAYVQALFDHYAPRFEQSLVKDLKYRAPAQLFEAVLTARAAAGKPVFFNRAIDLGCGTGLAGAAFGNQVGHLTGIDLSPGMIRQARCTGIYAELEVAEMVEGLQRRQETSVDLVVAADAMVYLSDLAPVLREIARVLGRGGMLAFTVETHDGEGVVLGAGLRYAHAAEYVRVTIGNAGLTLLHLESASPRMENHEPVPGLVVVAEKS